MRPTFILSLIISNVSMLWAMGSQACDLGEQISMTGWQLKVLQRGIKSVSQVESGRVKVSQFMGRAPFLENADATVYMSPRDYTRVLKEINGLASEGSPEMQVLARQLLVDVTTAEGLRSALSRSYQLGLKVDPQMVTERLKLIVPILQDRRVSDASRSKLLEAVLEAFSGREFEPARWVRNMTGAMSRTLSVKSRRRWNDYSVEVMRIFRTAMPFQLELEMARNSERTAGLKRNAARLQAEYQNLDRSADFSVELLEQITLFAKAALNERWFEREGRGDFAASQKAVSFFAELLADQGARCSEWLLLPVGNSTFRETLLQTLDWIVRDPRSKSGNSYFSASVIDAARTVRANTP